MLPLELARERHASQMLFLATLFWGISFPVMKALMSVQEILLPGRSSWFFTAAAVTLRFGLASLVMFVVSARTLRELTLREVWQGTVLGLFNAAGMLLQMDGLAYTSASVSAFLTQGTCVLIPLWVMFRDRRLPPRLTVLCCVVVMLGVAILARLDWRDIRLGRGELETLLASVFFTAQILWLERPVFARNNVRHFSAVMFGTIALATFPVMLGSLEQANDVAVLLRDSSVWLLTGILVIFCTLGAYVLMNQYQPRVAATKAGLIYCAEPIFASLFALFLPAWFSGWIGIVYENERITWSLFIGGSLITGANVVMQLQRPNLDLSPGFSSKGDPG